MVEASDGTKELRLGLVCYGGVSLAIYMHGVTKELHKLVVAKCDVDESPCQVAALRRPQGGIGKTLACAVSGDEILQDAQAFAEA